MRADRIRPYKLLTSQITPLGHRCVADLILCQPAVHPVYFNRSEIVQKFHFVVLAPYP